MNVTKLIADKDSPIVIIERVFDAPREKVFGVFTKANYVERWWGPSGTASVAELDFREGGRWEFQEGSSPEETITFHGYFHEITAPQRFVQTSEFDNLVQMIGERGHTVLAKYEFIELENNKTKLVTTEVYMSAQDRDMAIQSNMESGIVKSYQNIDQLLNKIA